MEFDFVIIGGGIAGLNAAIRLSKYGRVLVAAKELLRDCNTLFAQGGIAASLGKDDNPELHFQDTLTAGAGLCSEEAVRVMVEEAPRRIAELMAAGMVFDEAGGELALAREGAHSRNRVLHAGGDSTGKLIWQALAAVAGDCVNITVWEHAPVTDLIVADGVCLGVYVLDKSKKREKEIRSKAVLLASGGAGRLYPVTTNPSTATGDGMAMAYRGGAELRDMEFIQFHPTALAVPEAEGFLISEAVRGEGGILKNRDGVRFMSQYHHLGELAPRDIVSRAMYREMLLSGSSCVYLDVTHFEPGFFARRFPQIYEQLCRAGLNAETDLIPVAPAAHYMMGGVKTGLYGETNINGLFAAGEVANTGVHGANRLASNSLLEGLVFSARAVGLMAGIRKTRMGLIPVRQDTVHSVKPYNDKAKAVMNRYVGIVRNKENLEKGVKYFRDYMGEHTCSATGPSKIEDGNLGLLAYLSAFSALHREESRGGHFRADFPEKSKDWVRHITLKKGETGETVCLLSDTPSGKPQ